MKISYNWLKSYIEIDESPQVIAQWLTDCGLEVEAVEERHTVKGGLEGVIIGKVLASEKHPKADNLTINTVDIGYDTPLEIVCGAPNIEAGQFVPVATVGTTLYTNEGSFEIKQTKIRGQLSQGMICAEDELGLGASHNGIMVLNPNTPIGTPAKEYFNIEKDWVYEVGLTPNRIDAASHIGVARDLAAVTNYLYPKNKKQLKYPSADNFNTDDNTRLIPIEIEDEEACPRYSGLTISGVTVDESPNWLKNRLLSIGLKPVNNIVDITNFVLHEMGQPLHAFDADKITGNKVIVKRPQAGTNFITLDDESIELTGNDITVSNTKEPMCIAGILGGTLSGITNQTKNIFLESAYFNPKFIRNSSKHHQINTDASFRFERGADPNITVYAMKRAAMMITEIAGGKISSNIVDVYPKPIKNLIVDFSYDKLYKLAGKVINKNVVKNILNSLEIEILKEKDDILELSIPTYRVDVTRQADVAEEVMRIYGYNNIEIPVKLHSSIVLSPKPDKDHLQNQISDMLSGQGLREIMNNSLTNFAYYDNNTDYHAEQTVKIINPISGDLGVLRQTLLYGCLETIRENINHRNPDLKLYEFGNTYSLKADNSGNPHNKYHEAVELAIIITGCNYKENWKTDNIKVDFFDLKNYVNSIFNKFGIKHDNIKIAENTNFNSCNYALDYKINSKNIATIGKVSQKVLDHFDIKQDVFYASINWQNLINASTDSITKYEELPRFPEVRRDLALLINEKITYEEIKQIAFKTETKYLKNINLFDVYKDEKIGKNNKSYALSFILQDKEKTMTDKQIDKIMKKITDAYQKEINATIR